MILAIIQARTSSTRLPNKVLKKILDRPMLCLQIERVKRAQLIDKIILATSDHQVDQQLVELANKSGIACYQGSLNDVLARFYFAALQFQPKHVVRITGDCPVIDPSLIDKLIEFYLNGNYEYACLDESFPDGLDVEIMSWKCLSDAYHNSIFPSEREHVTLYINKNSNNYRFAKLKSEINCAELRWTVDEEKDFELIKSIYEALYKNNPSFTWIEILSFLQENPELMIYNTEYKRNEGLQKSLLNDENFLRERAHESI